MKELILVRHAKSSWKDESLPDFERPLNKRGKRDAPFMGNLLNRLVEKPDLILTSPATRASTTAKILAKEIGYPVDKIKKDIKIYLAEEVELFKIIKKTQDKFSKIILVGHNPGLTDFSNMLCNFPIENIPTSGIIHLRFNVDNWDQIIRKSGEMVCFEYPKKYLEITQKDEN